MRQVVRIGVDIAKRWFQIHAVDGIDEAVETLDYAGELDVARSEVHARSPQPVGARLARRFWIVAMVPRQIAMIANEMMVVTVPSA